MKNKQIREAFEALNDKVNQLGVTINYIVNCMNTNAIECKKVEAKWQEVREKTFDIDERLKNAVEK